MILKELITVIVKPKLVGDNPDYSRRAGTRQPLKVPFNPSHSMNYQQKTFTIPFTSIACFNIWKYSPKTPKLHFFFLLHL